MAQTEDVIDGTGGIGVMFVDRDSALMIEQPVNDVRSLGAGRPVTARLAFHAFDGMLAADSLHPHIRGRSMAAWHGIGLALLVVSVPAYLAGVLVAGLTGGVRMPERITGTARPRWTLQTWGPGTHRRRTNSCSVPAVRVRHAPIARPLWH